MFSRTSGRSRQRKSLAIHLSEWFQIGVFSAMNVYVTFRLGNMQLEGLPAFAGAAIALMLAFTALMYNRARAYPDGPTQRRSLLAAEKGLEAVLQALGTFIFIAIVFSQLQWSGSYPPTPIEKIPPHNLPGYFSLISSVMLIFTMMKIFDATGCVLSKAFRSKTMRDQIRHMRRSS